MVRVILHKGEERRLKSGHLWVFSNEIREVTGDRQPGAAAEFYSAGGEFLGSGYDNHHSLIAGRLLSRERCDVNAVDFFRGRLAAAQAYRQEIYPGWQTYRLVHGEGDLLPGLVVDRYGDYLAVQLLTAGLDRRREQVVAALVELFAPRGIIARNDVPVRSLEGLDQEVAVLAGTIPERLTTEEHGLSFQVDLMAGQKTGHFLDQKENHLLLNGLVAGKDVLDCFCYAGSWGIHAAAYGARSVTCLDISPRACQLVSDNTELNRVAERVSVEQVDVFDRLRSLRGEGRRFDTIILDPPAFVKSRKTLREAEKGYLTINRRALELLRPGGCLVTCTCSYHLGREEFRGIIARAAQQAGRTVRLRSVNGQAPDHPVLLAVPETEYLKCLVVQTID
ncbi:MAG TPA: class I SAM-dependent rRNA methyltransferase [Geobacteraceae bacterium]